MEFVVFERADAALLVVPAMFRAPVACGDGRPLRIVGKCDLELDVFSAPVVADLGLHGFALLDGADLETLRPHLQGAPPQPAGVPAMDTADPA